MTNTLRRNHSHPVKCIACSLMCLVFLCWSQVLMAEGNVAKKTSIIGYVVLQIGDASVTHSNGLKEPLQRGSSLQEGDTVKTRAGGHVHIKFIDEGAISVRPESRLHIELYKYDQQLPKKSAIRFMLEKGVMRSVSGKATEASHDRYRLNTPVAALGVLGTDYVVRVNEEETWVAVYSGGVAVAPISEGCLATSLGVCEGATHLTKDMGNLVLLYRSGDEQVQLKALIGSLGEEGAVEIDPVPEVQLLNSTDSPVEEPLAEREQLGEELAIVTEPRELSGALKWGRWWDDALPGDAISESYTEAKSGRSITTGNERFALFRDESMPSHMMPQAGIVNFNLVQSFVYFFDASASKGAEPTLGRLNSGALEIDFARDTFSTHLNLSHPTVGNTSLGVQGDIGASGVFAAKNNSSSVAGAITRDGQEAGLLFQHKVNRGMFKGISDWAN